MRYILAACALLPEAQPDSDFADLRCPSLDNLERELLGQRLRRVSLVTRMSCICAVSCLEAVEKIDIPKVRLGVFHGTAVGNTTQLMGVTREILEEPGVLPSPIGFSSSMSNMSSFYVAQVTGAQGPNLVISQEEFSFENALLTASLAGDAGDVDFALVGGTDAIFGSREEYLRSMEYSPQLTLGEGAGWLLLGRSPVEALGEIVYSESLLDFPKKACHPGDLLLGEIVVQKIREYHQGQEEVWILPGLGVETAVLEDIVSRVSQVRVKEYLACTGVYPTAVANGIASLISGAHKEGLYVHIAKNHLGQAAMVLFRLKGRGI